MRVKAAAGRPARRSDPPVSLNRRANPRHGHLERPLRFQPDGSLRPAALPAAAFTRMHRSPVATKLLVAVKDWMCISRMTRQGQPLGRTYPGHKSQPRAYCP